jgi:RHS repeat-associated protein
VQYTYDENNNRIRKLQTGNDDEYYILGIDGQTESVFDENGKAKFYNITNGNEVIGRMIPPVNNLTLSNTTLSGTYEAQNQITTETNVSVTGTAVLKAGNTINLKPGFTASSGCNLTISVGAVTSDKYYYLKDHLGSVRVVVDTVGEIVSYSDYDAWGMILNGRSSNFGFADDKYKFTGKELDTETGYFYFGARAYDGRIGRWNVIDPLFEKYPNVSPYNYALNNPLRFIDPKGMEAVDATPDDPDDKNKQKSTINYFQELGSFIKEGISVISSNFEKFSNNLINDAENVSSDIMKDGPSTLNSVSENVFAAGAAQGSIISLTGNPEIGVPVIVGAGTVSTLLDATAWSMTFVDYTVNQGSTRLQNLRTQTMNMMLGWGVAKGIEKGALEVGKIIKDMTKYEIPSLFKFGF